MGYGAVIGHCPTSVALLCMAQDYASTDVYTSSGPSLHPPPCQLYDSRTHFCMTAPVFTLSDEAETRQRPLWLQVEDAIVRAISAGRLKPGEQLPGEHQLAEELGIHRHTVRRAIESLGGRGLLEVRRGRGTFVAARPIAYRVGGHSRFTGNIEAAGLVPSARVLRSGIVKATKDVADNLDLKPGDKVTALELLRMGDGIPILIARHYMPADRFPIRRAVREDPVDHQDVRQLRRHRLPPPGNAACGPSAHAAGSSGPSSAAQCAGACVGQRQCRPAGAADQLRFECVRRGACLDRDRRRRLKRVQEPRTARDCAALCAAYRSAQRGAAWLPAAS